MKLAQKHYRLLSIIKERGSVPSSVKPVVRKELSEMGLVEFLLGDEWMRDKERYNLLRAGEKYWMNMTLIWPQMRLKAPVRENETPVKIYRSLYFIKYSEIAIHIFIS
ncbi:hypothetical protein FD737_11925 [Pantoea sp. Seng]|uniref:hypothetical protein n=1 Tax=Pantoea sp. Seng TaxID=2576761 RepID=UPI0013291DBC|nr:hypothetical protein [Pantoea sp. Seng]MXP53788.1 hypothetical protein [Pantoea sp. Seng]